MKLLIERAELLRIVGPAVRVTERRNLIPILNNIRLTAATGRLTVTATDLDIEITTTTAADIAAEGAVTIPATTFLDLIRHLPEHGQVELTQSDDGRLLVRAGRSQTRLPTLPASDYPDISAGEMSHAFTLPAEIFAAMLRDTIFAASTEVALTHVCGVHLHLVESEAGAQLAAVASDYSRMLARRVTVLPQGAAGMPAVNLPSKTVGEIIRLLDKVKGEVAIEVSETKARISLGQTVLITGLLVATFPAYSQIIPAENVRAVTVEAGALTSAVERIGITADAEIKRGTTLNFAERLLTLSITNQASGEAREEVECDYEGEPFEIGFDNRLLARILGAVGGDTVLIRIGATGIGSINAQFATREGSDMFALLSPVRL